MELPKYDDFFNPVLKALQELGGSGSVSEIDKKVAEILQLSEAELSIPHKGGTSEVSYRLAWARNYLKNYGLLENSSRGVWALTTTGNSTKAVDKDEVKRKVKESHKMSKQLNNADETDELVEPINQEWKEKLLLEIMNLQPNEFERLAQRILRESGFVEVKVTGQSGDGGIDGKGIIKFGELVSIPVIFQCKRYKGTVPSKEVRDFRGAMSGRAEKGLFITTGTFTRDAREEATRDGVTIIDLIDGEQLVELMKRLSLGVKVSNVESIEINYEWFKSF